MEQRDDTFPSIWIVACSARFWPDGYSSYKRPCRGLPNNTALQSIRPCLPSATFPKAACETLFFFCSGRQSSSNSNLFSWPWFKNAEILQPRGSLATGWKRWIISGVLRIPFGVWAATYYDTEWITVREQSDKCQYKFFTFAVSVNCPPRNSEWNL